MKKAFLAIAMILTVALYTNLYAQKPAVVATNEPGWHHIGRTTASFRSQSESLGVIGADEFTAIKIKVSDAPLHLESLEVFYESGDREEIDVRDHFREGTESRAIKLKYPDKDIKRIAFTYKTARNAQGDKADIDVYGLKTNQPAGRDSYKDERQEIKQEARENERELRQESREMKRDAQSAGDKIEEGTKDAAAAITDQKLRYKVGPGGEAAYVDENGKYYYINNAGEKVFISKAQLRDKRDED